jgi:hypothetical protein
MRPIVKIHPTDIAGTKIVFNKYGDAKPYLIDQTCRYCHFCEMPILNSPAVEHIKPKECDGNKTKYANLKNEWCNLLLICTYCNSTKGNQDLKLYNFYLPYKHNTLIPFEHLTGSIIVDNSIEPAQQTKAQNTIDLYGLNSKSNSSGGKDTRFEHRLRVISQALERYTEYTSNPQQVTINAIVGQAVEAGFFSVWYNVFKTQQVVRYALIQAFKVPTTCFNATFNPIPRNPANPIDTI